MAQTHGRVEMRRCHAIDVEQWLPKDDPLRKWKGLRSVILVERYRSWGQEGERVAYVLYQQLTCRHAAPADVDPLTTGHRK